MGSDRVRSLVAAIFNTRDVEIDCQRFMDVVATYVDAEVGGLGTADVEATVPHHARMCPACAELYEALHHVAALEADGALPSADELWAELEAMVSTSPPHTTAADAGPGQGADRGRDSSGQHGSSSRAPGGARGGPDIGAARQGWLGGWRQSVSRQGLSRGWGPVTAAAALAIIAVLSVGWARSRGEAAELRQALNRVASSQVTRAASNEDGAWLRVDYAPAESGFVVWTGDLHEKSGVDRFRCWLIGKDGSRTAVGNFDMADHDSSWWMMEADGPMKEYEAVVITREPDGAEVLRAALTP